MARQAPLSCPGHTRPVVYLHYSALTPEGASCFISACKDGKPMLRKGDTGDWIGTFEGHKGAVWGACLNKNATMAATGAADFTAKLWDALSGSEKNTFNHKHIVKAVDFSQDGLKLLTGCNDRVVRVFDVSSSQILHTLEGHSSAIKCAVWSRDENQIISCAEENSIKVWDIRSSSAVKTLDFDAAITSIELSQDASTLTLAHGKTVSCLDAESYHTLETFPMPAVIYSASLHPTKSCFVVGGEDFKIYKFDYQEKQELESYKGHFGPVHCVRYSPDGEVYVSGSEDGTVRLWLNTVGKNYGLWKNPNDTAANSTTLTT